MELHLGKMVNKELIQWFNCSDAYFRKVHKKKIEELKNYAKFDVGRGYVVISEIMIAEYDPKMTSNKERIGKMVNEVWDESGLDTCINVARKIKKQLESSLSEDTICKYVREARNTLYGKPSVKPYMVEERGTIGSCEYIWCKKSDPLNKDKICKYYFLTPEEIEIKKHLLEKHYGSAEQNLEARSMADSLLKSGLITKADYYDTLNKLTGTKEDAFKYFIEELHDEIGGFIVRGTLVERDKEGIFFIEDGTDIEVPIE